MQGQGWRILQQREAYNLAFVVIRSVQKSASLDTLPYIIFGVYQHTIGALQVKFY